MKHLEIQNILFPLQHGFRRNHSCESQLLSLFQDLASSTTQTDMLIMDFSKAFDKVPHKRLNYKLNWYGIRGDTLEWITDFLCSRSQGVVLDGATSDSAPVLSGVPQGTVLGPILFLIYILQSDLNSVGSWAKTWLMQFNADTCFTMRTGRSKSKINASYNLHDQPLQSTDSVKYLGLTLTSDLKFTSHINNVTAKANSVLGPLRRNLKISSQAVKTQAYQSLVRPHLEYASTVWSLHLIISKKWWWCRDVLQGMSATAGITPAVLAKWLATSAGNPLLCVAVIWDCIQCTE